MTPDKNSEQPELTRQANAWVARLTSGQATVEDARALREWCATSPQHQAAYQDAARLWKRLGNLPRQSRPRPRRRYYLQSGLAACVLFLAVGWLQLDRDIGVQMLPSDYHTDTAERREITLADGSRIELDARTRLDLDFSAERRRIVLKGGAAVFHVQHDPTRPFVVEADNGSVTALGTVFEVRHQPESIRVVCSEGVVAVNQAGQAAQRLVAGQQLHYQSGSNGTPQPVNSSEALAWRQDQLVFKQRPLGELVAELNRYRPGHIILASDEAARRTLSGVFDLRRPDEALEHIRASLGLSATRLPGQWVVLR